MLKSRFPTRVLKDVPHRVDDHDDPCGAFWPGVSPGFFSKSQMCPNFEMEFNRHCNAKCNKSNLQMGHWHDHGPGKISRSVHLGFVGCTTGGMGFESQGILRWTCWLSYMRNIIGIDSHVFILCICTFMYNKNTGSVPGIQISWGVMLPGWSP